jgi:HEAT repeat protein
LLDRLHAVKALDGRAVTAHTEYLRALDDPHASVRYWAVLGLRYEASRPAFRDLPGEARNVGPPRPDVVEAVAKRLTDAAPVVRIAAAHALCDWGREAEALPVLVAALKHPTDSTRVHACVALNRIGEKARSALEQIRVLAEDPSEYVKRLTESTLRKLGAAPGG